MKITIVENEIKVAILGYLTGKGISLGEDTEVNMIPGRKGNGIYAEIQIGENNEVDINVIPQHELDEAAELNEDHRLDPDYQEEQDDLDFGGED
jgi:hypothetical protein